MLNISPIRILGCVLVGVKLRNLGKIENCVCGACTPYMDYYVVSSVVYKDRIVTKRIRPHWFGCAHFDQNPQYIVTVTRRVKKYRGFLNMMVEWGYEPTESTLIAMKQIG